MAKEAPKAAACVTGMAPSDEEMALNAMPEPLMAVPQPTIPLLCIVCPVTPKFSDISHLLTHIASKGHLHHETQTKLRAHQDQGAASTLQQYEIWYRQHGIETLLVERMRAKQSKLAKQTRRRTTPSKITSQTKTQIPSDRNSPFIKQEDAEDSQAPSAVAIYPGFLDDNVEVATLDTSSLSSEPMSLKGQVWPGIGKLDLADDEMRRTRNQRKPKSVIDKMRRTSEGILPDQVVMNPDFEVEVVKSVYEESPPPTTRNEAEDEPGNDGKPARLRRRAGRPPLTEISANVPRGGRTTRSRASKHAKPVSRHTPTPREVDIFCDENYLNEPSFGFPDQREQRFNLRNRTILSNTGSASLFGSPSPTPREPSFRGVPMANFVPGRLHNQPYYNHNGLADLGSENTYVMSDPSIYNNSTRLPFTGAPFLSLAQQEHYRVQPNEHYIPKQEEYATSTAVDEATRGSQYFNMTGTNPLLAHDRIFSGSYSSASNHHSGPADHAFGFPNVEMTRDHQRNNFPGHRFEKSVTVEPTTEQAEG